MIFTALTSIVLFSAAIVSHSARAATWVPTPQLPTAAAFVNPLRGYQEWNAHNFVPVSAPTPDSYGRFVWKDLEPAEDQYDFSPIERQLARLGAGRRYSFGVMPLFSWIPANKTLPDYLIHGLKKGFFWHDVSAPNTTFFIPDWNDPFYLERVDKLCQALGKKYDGDPRIAYVDIRLYGNYGEWHVVVGAKIPYDDPGVNPGRAALATIETKHAIIDSHVRAFPHTHLVMMTDERQALVYALRLNTAIPIGMRRDSFGTEHFERDLVAGMSADDRELVLNRWKVAPFVVEPIAPKDLKANGGGGFDVYDRQVKQFHISSVANGNFGGLHWDDLTADQKQAAIRAGNDAGYNLIPQKIEYDNIVRRKQQFVVTSAWANMGSAPVYETWRVTYALESASGRIAFTSASAVDLKRIMPDAASQGWTDRFTLPTSLAPGAYTLTMQIVDPRGYLRPMALAIAQPQGANGYCIGSVQIR